VRVLDRDARELRVLDLGLPHVRLCGGVSRREYMTKTELAALGEADSVSRDDLQQTVQEVLALRDLLERVLDASFSHVSQSLRSEIRDATK